MIDNNRAMADSEEQVLPPMQGDGLRHWRVAGGVIQHEGELLLVENLRRNGRRDWSPPGGVVEPGEATVDGLTREVEEETGLTVSAWSGPIYEVVMDAPDFGFRLQVEVHQAVSFAGDLTVDDPDGVVVDARFLPLAKAVEHLGDEQPWISEPLLDYLNGTVEEGLTYRYHLARGSDGRRIASRLP